jgi:hypothetical protein
MIKLIREEINFRYRELRHSAFSFYYYRICRISYATMAAEQDGDSVSTTVNLHGKKHKTEERKYLR